MSATFSSDMQLFNFDESAAADFAEPELYEIFMADGKVVEDENGLFWKEVLVEGEHAYRPGPGQKPVPIPLKIVEGYADDPHKEIGMADLIDSFDAGAIDHVTIPTTHQDKPEENTGFVKALKVAKDAGKARLLAGLDFTEPDIKAKAERGSIANTSVGVIFDYIKKDTGKVFKQALGHIALTNKPWITGMKPFGVAASECFSEDDIHSVMLAQVVWDSNKSLNWIRGQIESALNPNGFVEGGTQFYVADVAPKKALVAQLSSEGASEKNFVVPYKLEGDNIDIAAQENWVEANKEWVKASEDEIKKFVKDFESESKETLSEESAEQGASTEGNENGGTNMSKPSNEPEKKDDSSASGANPPENENQNLSEEARSLLSEHKAQTEAKFAEKDQEIEALRKKVHEGKVNERIEELKGMGFDEKSGLLKEIRKLKLASTDKPVLTLSEQKEEGGEKVEVELSADDIVERLIDAMPKTENGKLDFGEQALLTDDHGRPELETAPYSEEGAEERAAKAAKEMGREFATSSKDGDA